VDPNSPTNTRKENIWNSMGVFSQRSNAQDVLSRNYKVFTIHASENDVKKAVHARQSARHATITAVTLH